MKTYQKICLIPLCVATLFSTVACQANEIPQNSVSGEIEVWGKEATVNVMRNVEYDDGFKNEAKYEVLAGRGEYEASQIIITAPVGKTAEYTFEVSDLTCGEYTIDKSYIEVYNEKYINVITTTASYSTGTGWYADALLPFEKAIEYGENKVGDEKELRNQGIYIETFIPRDVPAGEYVGTFKLTVDGKTTNVPASVTVYDFEVSQESHLEQDWIVNLMGFGELNSTANVRYEYFEAVAGYRASTHSMSMGAKDADEWIQTVRKYTNPNLRDENGNPLIGEKECYLAAICLPMSYDATNGINRKTFDEYISRLVYWSIKDGYDYLAKTGTYPGFIDEPHYNNTWDKVKFCCDGWNTYKAYWANDILDAENLTIFNQKLGEGYELSESEFSALSEEFKAQLVESMGLIGFYVTTRPDDRLDENSTTQFCRPISSFNTASEKYKYDTWTDVETSGNWAYGAGTSHFGNRLDSEPVEQRLMAYYMYESNTKGFLVWETSQYQQIVWNPDARANQYAPCDPYALAQRIQNGAGDGFIFYPGKPYGIDGPVGSIRAHQYRDSSEDYEYFWLLEQLYGERGYSPKAVLSKLFSYLYDENAVTDDTEIFAKQRTEILNLIKLAQKGVFVTDFSENGGKATMKVVSVDEENIVKVNGSFVTASKEVTAQRDVFTEAGEVSITTSSGCAFALYLGGKATSVPISESALTVVGGTVTQGTEDGIKLEFSVDETVEEERRAYHFTFDADKKLISRETERLASEFYNPTDKAILIELWFMGKDGRTVFVDDVVAYPNQRVLLETTRLDLVGWGTIRSFEGIRFKVTSLEGESDYTIYFGGMYAVN